MRNNKYVNAEQHPTHSSINWIDLMYSLFIARYLSHVCFSTWRCDVVANNSQQRQHTPNPTAHLRIYCVEICKAFWLRLCHLRREHMNQRNKTRQIFSSDLRRNVLRWQTGLRCRVPTCRTTISVAISWSSNINPSSTAWLLCMPECRHHVAQSSHVSRKINKKKYIYGK